MGVGVFYKDAISPTAQFCQFAFIIKDCLNFKVNATLVMLESSEGMT